MINRDIVRDPYIEKTYLPLLNQLVGTTSGRGHRGTGRRGLQNGRHCGSADHLRKIRFQGIQWSHYWQVSPSPILHGFSFLASPPRRLGVSTRRSRRNRHIGYDSDL